MNFKVACLASLFSLGNLFLAIPTFGQWQPQVEKSYSRIAFGSCADEDKRQVILKRVVEAEPDLFIYLGDNIYGDTRDMDKLKQKYAKLGRKPEFQRLCKTVPILATWDDHDFGENDAGRYYPFAEASKEIFLDFWNEPLASSRWEHPGIYHAHILGKPGRRVQVILLDTRTFRDDLLHNNARQWKNDYRPNESPDSTFLGAKQWAWLEQQLLVPADLRIIASSNQFSHAYNGWESWNNVPREREKMLALIRKTEAKGLVFISGDVHWGELSRYDHPGNYPIYDLTSSGITQSWPDIEANNRRIGAPLYGKNFGMLRINWEMKDPEIEFILKNKKGKKVLSHSIRLSELDWH
ncbi:MAG TPA: alkaline phosphatase family protein [Bacteroidetes bacterium]|nr:alkaline phosphatase family protein [Bacteroidota bacterium]